MAPAEQRLSLQLPGLPRSLAYVILGTLGMSVAIVTFLEDPQSAAAYVSPPLYPTLIKSIRGELLRQSGTIVGARVPAGLILAAVSLWTAVTWAIGAAWLGRRSGSTFVSGLVAWGTGWLFWLLPAVWALTRLFAVGVSPSLAAFAASTTEFAVSAGLAGWLTTLAWLCMRFQRDTRAEVADSKKAVKNAKLKTAGEQDAARSMSRSRIKVGLAIGLYIAIFTAMNWGLWFNLRIPHGDSAMYEEHLWNVEHGKGFRSYLDPGLFLGEHIQVIHLFLIPLHLIWPSQLLMELCESTALAAGAWFVFRLTERKTGSARAAQWLAIAYLLYVPLHYLDIEIDLKTFRPEAFGVPLLLWTLWQLDCQRWKSATIGLVLTLLVKEDYPLVFAPLGAWIALFGHQGLPAGASRRFFRMYGAALILFSIVYLLVTVKFIIPWFKGQEVHYASYFAKFGKSTGEVMVNMLIRPGLLWNELVQMRSALYATYLLVPLAGLCLLSPTRLAVGLPTFMLLCLNELAQQPPAPVHHFHAPIVPILFWAAAAGLGNLGRSPRFAAGVAQWQKFVAGMTPGVTVDELPVIASAMAAGCAGLTGVFIGFTPFSLKFWEPGQTHYWRELYVPGERPKQFAKIADLIPRTARVASTDFVHPRYTHFERSYDYSDYVRAVSEFTTNVPADTEYIVIDTQHPYSRIKSLENVHEWKVEPQAWEVLPDRTAGYFIVLRRRSAIERKDGDPP